MSKTLDAMTFGDWIWGGTDGFARYTFSDDFVDENGVRFEGSPSYIEVPTTIVGRVVTIPAYPNFPETEAAVLNNGVTVTCTLLDSTRAKKATLFDSVRIYTSLPSTVSLSQLVLANGASRLLRDTDVWTKEQVMDYVNTLPPAAKMTAAAYGIGRLFRAATDPADPILVGHNDPRVNAEKFVGEYASLAAAVAAIGSTETTLVIDSAISAVGVTVPANITLRFTNTGQLTGSGSVTIQGPIIAPARQIFASTLTVSFVKNSKLVTAVPQWWGDIGKGRTVTVCSTTNGSPVLNCTNGDFTSDDVGKDITVYLVSNWGRGLTEGYVVGGSAGAAGVPLFGTVLSVQGPTQLTMSINASATLSGTVGGATVGTSHNAFLGTDDTAAIQRAFTATDTNGVELFFPAGDYCIKGTGTQLLLLTRARRITGAGSFSRIMVAPNVGASVDVLRFAPPGDYMPSFTGGTAGNEVFPWNRPNRFLRISGLMIEPVAGRPARYGLHLDFTGAPASYGPYLHSFLFTENMLGPFGAIESLYIDNAGPAQINAVSASTIERNFLHGIKGDFVGDTVQIRDNEIRGDGHIADLSFASGATTCSIEHNNAIAARGVHIASGAKVSIQRNIFELFYLDGGGGAGSNGAVIDIDGNVGRVDGTVISHNQISGFDPTELDGVRIDNAVDTVVEDNQIDVRASDGKVGVKIVGTNTYTRVDANRMLESGTTAGVELDSGMDITTYRRVFATVNTPIASNPSFLAYNAGQFISLSRGVALYGIDKTLNSNGLTDVNSIFLHSIIEIDSTATNRIVNLPAIVNAMLGIQILIKKTAAANTVTINAGGSDQIEGAASVVLNSLWENVHLYAASLLRWSRIT